MENLILPDADQGVYEFALVADTVQTITLESPAHIVVLVHSMDAPVDARVGVAVGIKDGKATIVPPGSWSDVPGSSLAFSVISAGAAVVSIARA